MMTTAEASMNMAPEAGSGENTAGDASRRHIRGSSLMLVGRVVSLGMSFLIQVLSVRYLTKADYGAYAYALTVVNIGSMLALLCLDKALARFLPYYHEREEYGRLWGTVLLAALSSVGLGTLLVLLFHLGGGWIGGAFIRDPRAAALVLLMIALVPVDALETLLGNLFAVFARPRDIFFPRHVLGPVLYLAAVLVFVLRRGDVFFLAWAILAAAVAGTGIHLLLLLRLLRQEGLLARFDPRSIRVPWRDLLGFSLPLLVTDVVFVLRGLLVVLLLERFGTTLDVAAFQAVLPLARLNQLVHQSFLVLYMPVAGRLLAREDRAGINDLYWQSAVWIAVASFPMLAVSFSLAQPVTVLLFGDRYEQSAPVLALLASGHFFSAALGFNGLTLQLFGRVRYLLIVDLVGAAAGLALNLLLIGRYGAAGAAVGTCFTLVLQALLYQAGLRSAGVRPLEPRFLRACGTVVLAAGGLFLAQQVTGMPVYLALPLAAAVSLAVLGLNRGGLQVGSTFPELLRVPLLRRFLAA
jgi:O-antigen/teichoic acid export membrane protein